MTFKAISFDSSFVAQDNTGNTMPMTTLSRFFSAESFSSSTSVSSGSSVTGTGSSSGRSSNSSGSKRKPDMTELPADFVPNPYSVICGLNTREVLQSTGNTRFKLTVSMFMNEYEAAKGKAAKSAIVTRVMAIIREASPEGTFIKYKNGRWYEISERGAREKVGAMFRDCLHTKYKSSHKSKTAKKQEQRLKMTLETLKMEPPTRVSSSSLKRVDSMGSISCENLDLPDFTVPLGDWQM